MRWLENVMLEQFDASAVQVTFQLYVREFFFFFQAEDGIRDLTLTGVQTCALPIYLGINAIATIGSIEPRTALLGSFDEDKGLITLEAMVGCLVLAAGWVRTEAALAPVVAALSVDRKSVV